MSNLNQPDDRTGLPARIWRSIFRGPILPRDDRDRRRILFNTLILHFRPARVREETIRYTHTWGLGGSSLILFLILITTGVLLMFVYEPSPGGAYDSVASLQSNVFFGKLIRNIHHWSANFLIAFLVLHLLRVYLTGAYYPPRQFNWVIGLSLLGCVLLSNFTGYLLPWDQLSYWATTIVTGMIGYIPLAGGWFQGLIRGGPEIGGKTLVNFYAAHTTVIPVVIIVLMGFHFWRVRKARGVVVPRPPEDTVRARSDAAVTPGTAAAARLDQSSAARADDTGAVPRGDGGRFERQGNHSEVTGPGDNGEGKPEYVMTLPHLILREFSVGLALVAAVMVVALVFNADLGGRANPGMSPNPAKAPWYFVGFQELVLLFDPLFAGLIIPALAAVGLLLIPYFKYGRDTSGVFMMSHEGRRLALIAALIAVVATPLYVVLDEFWIDFPGWLPGMPPVVANGVLPAVILFGALAALYAWFRRREHVMNNEAVQAMFVLLAVGFAVLTVIGVWFRGPGMALVWPWNL
ncbi:MAG: cytochrome b N-terminal domain-containing protein [bacterium]